MKKYPHAILAAFLGGYSLGPAAEEQLSPSKHTPAEITTARILGDIPDGTPLPPELLKPKFIVPAPLSLVHIWPQGKGEAIAFWSSADFGSLSGVSSFVGSD